MVSNALVALTIEGNPPRKSNSRRFVRNSRSKKPMLIRSPAALAYERDFAAQVPSRFRLRLSGPLLLQLEIYFRSWRSDLDLETVMDCLERSRVIDNDRSIVRAEVSKYKDSKRPRAEIKIWRFGQWEGWDVILSSAREEGRPRSWQK